MYECINQAHIKDEACRYKCHRYDKHFNCCAIEVNPSELCQHYKRRHCHYVPGIKIDIIDIIDGRIESLTKPCECGDISALIDEKLDEALSGISTMIDEAIDNRFQSEGDKAAFILNSGDAAEDELEYNNQFDTEIVYGG